jgi:glutathione S-transferase
MLQLYDLAGAEPDRRFSPYCWRIRMALAHKGLEVETIPWRFTEKDAVAKAGGAGRVPVLVDGGRWIGESWDIANHIEATWPGRPSLFGCEAGVALTRFYQGWANGVLHPALLRLVVLDVWRHADAKDQAYFRMSRERLLGATLEDVAAGRAARLPSFRELLTPLRATVQAQSFLGGDRPLYADYVAFGAFQWARCISDFRLLEPDDPVFAWRERMLDLYGGLARRAKGYPV